MAPDIQLENELTKNNSDYTEWHAVLCQYARIRGATTITEDVGWDRDSYASGLTPAEAWNSTLNPVV
jgi:hypothetical protein